MLQNFSSIYVLLVNEELIKDDRIKIMPFFKSGRDSFLIDVVIKEITQKHDALYFLYIETNE